MYRPPKLTGKSSRSFNDPRLKRLLLVDSTQQSPIQPDHHQASSKSIRYPSPKASSNINNSAEPHQNKRPTSRSLYAHALMDRIWNGYRRQANKGSVTLFRLLRPNILAVARKMYGEDGVADVVYGRHKDTAYVLIQLAREPEGAEGHASDEFMALNANFYEVLKDGQAGEADVIAAMSPWVVAKEGLAGASLVDLYEVQVHHPISGRLLVGPIEKQKRFMGL
ncbi:hypothetical protein PFICI_05691 [Pestalotiopsis fici W106-1]|uniref:Uncharacterized protein n=1 Tax=Pestalotiopsis fici (strain W106-1 / CGMCC3.15140) TaxID=1229662 RepID=W3XCN0_PESFW|nr:uncharacterized protein PFICI_05691 [Pestalotiopsis fici W106-1]ETS83815.1 hypothetical protein PFICI_05691 [Pestalotiopsis fici W106-1]